MSRDARRPARALGPHRLGEGWGKRRGDAAPARSRRRRRQRQRGAIESVLERLETRTMLSTTPAPIVGPIPVSTQQETLNLVLQPSSSGALGSLAGLIASAGATVQATGIPDLYEVQAPPSVVPSLEAALSASPAVESAALPQTMSVADAPNDPSYDNDTQWYLNGHFGINAPAGWGVITGSTQVIVADTDTGISYNEPELLNNIWINQAEIPASVRTNLTDTNGDGLITFADLNAKVNGVAINQGSGKIEPTSGSGGVVNGSAVLATLSSGGWADGSTQDGDSANPDDLIGWNFVANTNNPIDQDGHGTFTAGEIAAVANNATGVAGADWSVQIMGDQFLDSSGNGSDTAAAEAIEYAVQHGAKVINASWGGSGVDPTIAAAIQYADQYGVIIVAAAGNNGSDNDNASSFFAPASYSVDYPNLISVAATTINGKLAGFSDYGVQSVQIAAPGWQLYGLGLNNTYTTDSGTSMAAPLVTATVALVEAAHPTWSMSQVMDAVIDTATSDPYLVGDVTSGGIVNVQAAVANTDGPYVVSSTPSSAISGPSGFSNIQLTFNEEINPATFAPGDVTLSGPGGSISGISVAAVAGSNDHTFDIAFPDQSAAGSYTLKVGPSIQDWYGNDMNQNRNGVNGEASDAYTEMIKEASGMSSDVFLIKSSSTTATAGAPFAFTVTALAANGSVDTSFVGPVDFSSSDPQAVLPANFTFTASNDGTHSFNITFKTAGIQSITATTSPLAIASGTEGNIFVEPAAAKSLVVATSGNPTAGVPFPVTVTAYDTYGNVATSYVGTIDFSSTDPAAEFPVTYNGNFPAAVVPATYSFAPEQQGTGTFYVTFETSGTQSLTATDSSSPSITGTASGLAVAGGSAALANPDATATTFANPIGSATSGQSVTLTATVKATTTGAANPTDGSVTFFNGSTALGTANLSGSDQATWPTGPLSAGTFNFFAVYDGDAATYQPSASPVFSQVVNHFATNVALAESSPTSSFGQAVTFTATVSVQSAQGASPPVPTGTVTFFDGTTPLGTLALNGSLQAALTTSALVPGTHSILAVYNGDSLTQTNQSVTLTQTVSPPSQSVVYVNSAWSGDASGTQVSVGGTTLTVGTNAFATIQAGVDGAAAGGTVNVLAGTYSGQVVIDDSLKLAGAGAASTTLTAPASAASGGQIAIDGGQSVSVTISGLALSGTSLLTGIADDEGASLTATGVTIGGDDIGVSVENLSTATITGSTITGDNTGIWVADAATATVTGSAINGCTMGILVGNGGGDISVLTAQEDNLAGNVMGVDDVQNTSVSTAPEAVATLDWWGSAGGPGSAGSSPVSGAVNFTPWLDEATPDSLVFSTVAGDAWTVTPNNSGPSLTVALAGTAVGTVSAGGSIQFTGSGGTLTIDGESGTGYNTDVFNISNSAVEFAAADAYNGTTISYSGITAREVYALGTVNTFNITGTGTGGTGGDLWSASSGTNTFTFTGASALAGNIQGAASSTLNYAGYGSGVSVNLASGTGGSAAGVGGTVAGITAIIGSAYNDTLNAGSVSGVALTGGLGSNTLSGTGSGDSVVESFATGYTLTNTILTATTVAASDSLGGTGITIAGLTDTGSGHTFTLTGWTGAATLSGTGETIADSVSANVTLSSSSLAVTGLPAIAMSGFTAANLAETVAGNTFTVSAWMGTGSLTGAGAGDMVAASKAGGFTLSNTALTSGAMSLGLSDMSAATLTDTSSGGNTFTINGWTGGGTLSGTNETLAVNASANLTLSNTSLTGAGGLALTLSGFKTAQLTDPTGGHTFNITGWTGAATLAGSSETVADSVSANVTLTSTSLAVTGLPTVTLGGFTAANLTDTTGGHSFTVSGWTGMGSLLDAGTSADSITASKASGYTLSNTSLSSTDGMSLGLTNFSTATLTDTGSGHTFTLTGWTGAATLSGTSETIADSVSANVTLSSSSLAVTGLPAIAMSGFTAANLAETVAGNTFTVSAWMGTGSLTGAGAGDMVAASKAGGFTLSNTALTSGAMSLGLSDMSAATLTDTSSGGNTFTINGWTGGGTLSGTNETLAVNASANLTLSNTSLTGTGGLALTLSGFKTADLTDPTGGHTFNITGWTGAATLAGSSETVADSVSANVTLTSTSLAVTGLPTVTLGGFTAANLTDTTGGHSFTVSGWTGMGSLVDAGTSADSITASKASGYTLSNTSLSSTDGMSLGLTNFSTATLTDTGSGHTFTLTGWTGAATLSGTSETIAESVSANVTLTSTSLAVTGLPAVTLGGFTVANLTDTTGGHGFTVSGWTGTGSLDDTVVSAPDSITASKMGVGYTLKNTSLSTTGGMSLGLTNFSTATLTDTGSGHTFTLTGWTGGGTLSGTNETLVVNASANLALSNTALTGTGGLALTLSGFTATNLTDTSAGGHTFNITGWTGAATLAGSNETLSDSVSANVTLTNTSLAVTGLPTVTLGGFTAANLTDTTGGHSFHIGAWTGTGSLDDTVVSAPDSITAIKASGYTLSNTSLSSTDGMSLGLTNFSTATLTDTGSGHTFTLTGWTGAATLSGTSETIADSVSANVTLTSTSLAVTGLPAVTLGGFTVANLTDTTGGHGFTVSGWTGTGSLDDTVVSAPDSITASKMGVGYTLKNTSLSTTGGMSLGLTNFSTATLTDTGSGHTFTLTGWTGGGTLSGTNETLVVNASANLALSNTALTGTGGLALTLSGFTATNLTDTSAGGHTFNITGWTGAATLAGSNETLSDSVSANVTLTNTSLAVTGLPTVTLGGFTAANLTDTTGGHSFHIGAWTGTGSLDDTVVSAPDSITAIKASGYTLSNTSLSSTDGMSLGLTNFSTATLTDTGSGHTFTLTGWTGAATLSGTSETIADSVSANVTLTSTSLAVTGLPAIALSGFTAVNLAETAAGYAFTVSSWTGTGTLAGAGAGDTVTASKTSNMTLTNSSLVAGTMSLGLSGITSANLTVTASSGNPVYVVDASAFTGTTGLSATGTVAAILFGGAGSGSVLATTSSGNSILIGGAGSDTLTDTGSGYNILISGGGADALTANGKDILISGTTNYDANTSANIAALDAILAEWDSADAYATKISKISSGVGSGGTDALSTATVQPDRAASTLSDGTAATQNNWFLASSSDTVTKKANETETII